MSATNTNNKKPKSAKKKLLTRDDIFAPHVHKDGSRAHVNIPCPYCGKMDLVFFHEEGAKRPVYGCERCRELFDSTTPNPIFDHVPETLRKFSAPPEGHGSYVKGVACAHCTRTDQVFIQDNMSQLETEFGCARCRMHFKAGIPSFGCSATAYVEAMDKAGENHFVETMTKIHLTGETFAWLSKLLGELQYVASAFEGQGALQGVFPPDVAKVFAYRFRQTVKEYSDCVDIRYSAPEFLIDV